LETDQQAQPDNTARDNRGHLLISGASGLIGSALSQALQSDGYTVHRLQRVNTTPSSSAGGFYYLTGENKVVLDPAVPLLGVINLAGPSIADKRWNPARKQLIKDSRVNLTRALAESLAAAQQKPQVFLSASAIGYYGANPDQTVTEHSAPGDDFLAEVASSWEAATTPASEAGIRTVLMRFGIVLSSRGGVVGNLVLPLRSAVVGRIGDGRQLYSWVSLADVVAFIQHALCSDKAVGAVNLVSSRPSSADALSRTLASTLHRFRLPPLSAGLVRAMFGEMGNALLLASADVRSERLQETGYKLQHDSLEPALKALYRESL
jgi:uncharacterized protein (TIGR01777 family)